MKVPLCEKSKDVIEYIVKPQWWMRMREMADAAIEVVRNGEIKIRPEAAEKSYFRWLENINDWCLSRKIWWGHQIPAYLVKFEGERGEKLSSDDDLGSRVARNRKHGKRQKGNSPTPSLHLSEILTS